MKGGKRGGKAFGKYRNSTCSFSNIESWKKYRTLANSFRERERERDRETDRQTDTHTHTHRENESSHECNKDHIVL